MALCQSRPTLYRAEHHTPMGRALRCYALEYLGAYAALTCVCPSSTTINCGGKSHTNFTINLLAKRTQEHGRTTNNATHALTHTAR